MTEVERYRIIIALIIVKDFILRLRRQGTRLPIVLVRQARYVGQSSGVQLVSLAGLFALRLAGVPAQERDC